MNTDAPIVDEDQREKQNTFAEVANAEKQLWGLIHSKGLLRIDVQDLYRKARSGYEDIILNDHEEMELQDVEYCLWKLHYKHIDEYRKRIRKSSGNAENMKSGTPQDVASVQNSIDDHMEGFKSFLSEASEFYKDLIRKIKKYCGLPEEPPLNNKDVSSFLAETTKFHKCQYACHRFLVCLGDLARYRELCKKSDYRNCKWSIASTYYFEAAIIWPDSGNPQNQLALLATYVGDDFLALYHCVRSLAIKEPFPDAWDNLMLLFEKNRSSPLHSLSSEAHFDFLKPSEKCCSWMKSQQAPGGSSNNNKLEVSEHVSPGKTDLWPLFVRLTGFFFLKSSSEDFPCTFASTMRELEALLASDDTELKTSLESYEHMDSARRGPYRALQLVSILIFIINSLSESPELKNSIEKNVMQHSDLGQLAWIATFICMGRLLERCLMASHLDSCPLLVTVLVFVEWLIGMLARAETYGAHEKVRIATSYFFGGFCNLLNRLDDKEGEVKFLDHTALWEDHELRSFSPLAYAHMLLDFSTHREHMDNYDNRYICRSHRILHAAMKIAEQSSDSWKWIFYDNLGRKFYTEESIKFPHQREAEVVESSSDVEVKYTKQYEKESGENQGHHHCVKASAAMEEEEVILFKPITRYNSEPIYSLMSSERKSDQTAPSDEILCRATSLFTPQNEAQIDPSNFHPDTTNFRFNKPFKQQEPLLKDSATYPAGPPSLSGWVFNRESMHVEREKGTRDFHRHELSPIEEIPSASLAALSIKEKDFSATNRNSPPPYVASVPSAPQLPDNAVWFRGHSSSFSECETGVGIREAEGILGASPISGYSNLSPTHGPYDIISPRLPGFIDGYPPLLGMSSSEWLYQYRNSHNLEQANSHIWPVHFNSPGDLGNFHRHNASRFDLFDRWGNPLASNQMVYLENPQLHQGLSLYGTDEQRREKLFLGYQRPSPYGCGAGTDFRAEQPPLVQYLKEKEWQLQRESQVRGPAYMGN